MIQYRQERREKTLDKKENGKKNEYIASVVNLITATINLIASILILSSR